MSSRPLGHPRKAKPTSDAKEAWWYQDARGIEIYIQGPGGLLSCRLTKRQILQWLKNVKGAGL